MRLCAMCDRDKPDEQFSQHPSYCKPCNAVYGGAWDESNRQHNWPGRLATEPYRTMIRWAADVGASSPQLRDLGRRLVRASGTGAAFPTATIGAEQ